MSLLVGRWGEAQAQHWQLTQHCFLGVALEPINENEHSEDHAAVDGVGFAVGVDGGATLGTVEFAPLDLPPLAANVHLDKPACNHVPIPIGVPSPHRRNDELVSLMIVVQYLDWRFVERAALTAAVEEDDYGRGRQR